ncbi:MAG: hypothetical protein ACE37J_20540 [Pikeienuella sp.]
MNRDETKAPPPDRRELLNPETGAELAQDFGLERLMDLLRPHSPAGEAR